MQGEAHTLRSAPALLLVLAASVGLSCATLLGAQCCVSGLPTTFFIEPKGIIRSIRVGSMPLEELESNLREIFP